MEGDSSLSNQIERLLTRIDHEIQKPNWPAVKKLADEILSVNPDYVDAQVFLRMADRQLSTQQESREVVKSPAIDVDRTFVGREKEMSRLRSEMDEIIAGRGRLVMLVGEPGIGKTRTSQQFATYASTQGVCVLSGRCFEGQEAPAYLPWVQAIRTYVRACDEKKLKAEMGAAVSVITELVGEVREKLKAVKPALKLDDPQSARFRLFDSVTLFLKRASESQPLIIVLDDLHWADEPSLKLLEFILSGQFRQCSQ